MRNDLAPVLRGPSIRTACPFRRLWMPHVVVWTLCRALIDILETLSNGRASQAFLSDGSRRIPHGNDWPTENDIDCHDIPLCAEYYYSEPW